MGVQIRNSSLEPVALPHPLQGILRGRQAVRLSMAYSSLTASFPSVTNGALEITDLGDSWSGTNDDASYGPATSVNDATNDAASTVATFTHTTTGTAAANIGTRLLFRTENDAGSVVTSGAVVSGLADVTASSEVGGVAMVPAYAGTLAGAGLVVTANDASAVNGWIAVPSATGVYVRLHLYGSDTNIAARISGKGTGSISLVGGDNTTIGVTVNNTGLSFFNAPTVAQQAAQAALTLSVAGDMPGPTGGEIATRLNLIENRLNAVSAALRNLGLIAT